MPSKKANNKRQRTTTTIGGSPLVESCASTAAAGAPRRTIVLDNGGDTVRYGWSTDAAPQSMPNVTGRLPHSYWSVLIGDQIVSTLQNPNTAILSRSFERFVIHNLGNQIQVWKRILDRMGVTIPLSNSELAGLFGWTNNPSSIAASGNTTAVSSDSPTRNKNTTAASAAASAGSSTILIPASQCAILIGLPALMPRCILDQIVQIWWNEFGIPHVGFFISGVAAATEQPTKIMIDIGNITKNDDTATSAKEEQNSCCLIACVVDMGWSGCTVLPVYQQRIITTTTTATATNSNDNKKSKEMEPVLRRLHIGGRHMIQMYKYYFTYRQYNLMDQEFVLRQVLEQTAQISLDYTNDMRQASRNNNTASQRPLYDLDYVLPDYETTKVGMVQIPVSVQQQLDRLAKQQQNKTMTLNDEQKDEEEQDDEEDEDDEDFQVDESRIQQDDDDDDALAPDAILEPSDNDDDDAEQEDDDEEDEKTRRERILAQRRAEEERRKNQQAEQQVLKISLERFAIPEILFHPQDGGLPAQWANLPMAIVQCIEACPEICRAGLYRAIQLTGGLSQLPNLQQRLEQEIRCLVHPDYEIHIRSLPNPMEAAWKGGCRLANEHSYTKWSVSSSAGTPKGSSAWKKLLISEGGYYF